MLLEIVILLSIANIVFIVLIMKLCNLGAVKNKKQAEEEEEYEDPEPEPEPQPAPEKLQIRIAEKLHLKKKEKHRRHVSEMPDMNKVISELQSEFKKGSGKKSKNKKSKNDLQDRFEEIEKS